MTLKRFEEKTVTDTQWRRATTLRDRSGLVPFFEQAMAPTGPRTGRPPNQDRYTVNAVLTALLLVIAAQDIPNLATALRVLWSLPPDRVAELGLESVVTPEKKAQMRRITPAEGKNRTALLTKEYYSIFRTFNTMMNTIDSSPHPRNTPETVQARRLRVARLTHAERHDLRLREDRFLKVIDLVISAGCAGGRPDHYTGDVILDETWLDSHGATVGRGYRQPHLKAPADPDVFLRPKKGPKKGWAYVHMLVFAGPAPKPNGRSVPEIVTGFYIRKHGDSITDSAIATLRSHVASGFGATRGFGIVIADRGYTAEQDDFAIRMAEEGYHVTASADQPQPVNEVDYVLTEPAREPRLPLVELGVYMFAGRFICPAGAHLRPFRDLRPLNESKATDADLQHRQEIIDELRLYTMPTNGLPRRVVRPGRLQGWATYEVLCPALAGLVNCPLQPDSGIRSPQPRPIAHMAPDEPYPVCRQAYTRVHIPVRLMKHVDVDLRGSFEHTDRFALRSAIERINSDIKRFDTANLNGPALQTVGRVRIGFLAACTAAMQSMIRIEGYIEDYGSVHSMPYTRRFHLRRARARRLARRLRTSKAARNRER